MAPNTKTSWLSQELASLKDQGLYNTIRIIESPVEGSVVIDGKKLLNFCSNNYLGLANDPRLKEAAKTAIDTYGVGPGAVRTIAGTTTLHRELEEHLAAFKKVEAVIVLGSGFSANLAVVPALTGEGGVIFSDELNHASIIDACRLSKAEVVRFAHADAGDLAQKITRHTGFKRGLVVTDGVFSMDGDLAPLPALYEVIKDYDNVLLMVDDAHGEGVLGDHGRGIVDHFGMHGKVDIEVGTMSKAFGVVGGYVAGSAELIEWLTQRARPFLFSSALTIPDTAASLAAVEILVQSDELVKKLWSNAAYFKESMAKLGFDTGHSETPIVPIMLGEAPLAQDFSKKLFEQGVFAKAIGYPTVPQGKARIRVMNTAAHTKEDLDRALSAFETAGRELAILS